MVPPRILLSPFDLYQLEIQLIAQMGLNIARWNIALIEVYVNHGLVGPVAQMGAD